MTTNKKKTIHNGNSLESTNGHNFEPGLLVSGINTPICVQILINATGFVLGKSDSCNGVLSFNEEISREHCKIVWHDDQYFIIDLNSTNGTYLNDEILVPSQEYPIRPGDHIRLSASTFLVEQIYSATRR